MAQVQNDTGLSDSSLKTGGVQSLQDELESDPVPGCRVDPETAQIHLARQFARWGKYAKFSKDPLFQKRCAMAKMEIISLMSRPSR